MSAGTVAVGLVILVASVVISPAASLSPLIAVMPMWRRQRLNPSAVLA